MDLVALAFALVVVWLARLIRALGALPFARTTADWTTDRPPEVLADIYQQAFAVARAKGFGDPRWVAVSSANDEKPDIFAVLAHPDGGLLWLAPPVVAGKVRRLFAMATSRLQDGRCVISQNFDAYYATSSTDEVHGRVGGEADLDDFVSGHYAYVAGLGVPVAIEDDAAVLDQFSGLIERHRQALIADGRLEAVDENKALPRLGFAIAIFRAYLGIPKAPRELGPFPAAMLEAHVERAEKLAARAPLRRIELVLLGSSMIAFAFAGALLWDPWFSISLLVVIVIHELGHFLAMRAMGYENVHFLALPLVGGVTMGRDASPSATKQVWMSLMGPLPGIPIGVVLVALSAGADNPMESPLFMAGVLFLTLNFLNLLPVPPLDGARVLEGMVPPRYAKLQTVVFAMIAAAAALAGAIFDMWIIAAVAGFQLLGVKRRWRLHDVEAELAREMPPGRGHDDTAPRVVLEALERRFGPAESPRRVNEAVAVRDRLRTQPMGWGGRIVVGGVYFGAFAAPALVAVVFGVFAALSNLPDFGGGLDEQEIAEIESRVTAMSLREQLETTTSSAVPPPATAAQIDTVERRLGRPLPADLRRFYLVANGAPGLDLAAVDTLRAPTAEELAGIPPAITEDGSWPRPTTKPDDLLLLGTGEATTLYAISSGVLPAELRLARANEAYTLLYDSLDEFVAELAHQRMVGAYVDRALARRQAKRRAELRDASIDEVLDAAFERTAAIRIFAAERSPGASDATLQETEERLGLLLPPQLRAVLKRHDPPELFTLLGSADLARFSDTDAELPSVATSIETSSSAGGVDVELAGPEEVAECLVAAGRKLPTRPLYPTLLWCPERAAASRWIEPTRGRGYASLREWLIELTVMSGR